VKATKPESVALKFTDKHLICTTENATLALILHDGKFPPVDKVMPKDLDGVAKVDKAYLMNGIKRACILMNPNNKIVELTFTQGVLRLHTTNDALGSANLEMPLKYEGEAFNIKFNPEFIINVLKVLDGGIVEIKVRDGKRPIMIKEKNSTHILLPIKVEEHE
jgi:DNA polymerase-3 subunit beta